MTCDLKKLRILCRGHDNEVAIEEGIRSLERKKSHAAYYYNEYKVLSEPFTTSTHHAIKSTIENRGAFIAINAHISAVIHNLHAIPDILGYLIKNILKLKLREKVYISDVVKALKDSEYGTLQSLIDGLNKIEYYKYMNDLNNHNKHRFHIGTVLKLKDGVEFSIEAFEKEGLRYPKYPVDLVINVLYNQLSESIINIENELIRLLDAPGRRSQSIFLET